LSLTSAGRSLIRKAPDALQERLIGALEQMPPGDRSALAGMLQTLVDALGASNESAAMFFEEDAGPGPEAVRQRGKARKAGGLG
jgi:hypothetical protein